MMTAYIALIRKQPDSDYGVEVPDFPGCITAGKSLEEARRMASEALNCHIAGMVEDGETIPILPRSMKSWPTPIMRARWQCWSMLPPAAPLFG